MLRSPESGCTGHPPITHPQPGLSQDTLLLRINELLAAHISDPTLNVNWLADKLAINRKTLYRKVQNLLRLTPSDLIRQYQLRKAVELLRKGYTISQTASLIGFRSSSHFASVFKEFYRQTPSEFIASQLKKV